MVFEKLICYLCGSECHNFFNLKNLPKGAQLFSKNKITSKTLKSNFIVFECHECNFVQTKVKKVSYYKNTIRSSSFSERMMNFRKDQFKNIMIEKNINDTSVFEIGCGQGEYLDIFKDLGYKTYGIEGSKKNFNKAVKKGHNVENNFLNKKYLNTFFKDKFDLLVSFNFIEHLPDPKVSLKIAKSLLKTNGIGILEVPNFNVIKDKFLFNEFIPDHLFYYTKETFHLLLELSGFQVLNMKTIEDDYIISAFVKVKNKISWVSFENQRKYLKRQIEDFYLNSPKKNNFIWSAGHQSLTTISTLGLEKLISNIVDSSTYKQNKFAPASGIEIISPEQLIKLQPKKIILAAAGYNSEIIEILKDKYKLKINIACLDKGKLDVLKV